MAPPFSVTEYEDRLQRTRAAMTAHGVDALIIGDPANINWLTGYDAWSFYTPQIMAVSLDRGPYWMGREMDAGAAAFSSCLEPTQLVPYPEDLVQTVGAHPADFMAGWLQDHAFDGLRIGYESDTYFFSPRALSQTTSRPSQCDLGRRGSAGELGPRGEEPGRGRRVGSGGRDCGMRHADRLRWRATGGATVRSDGRGGGRASARYA